VSFSISGTSHVSCSPPYLPTNGDGYFSAAGTRWLPCVPRLARVIDCLRHRSWLPPWFGTLAPRRRLGPIL
jgi:hypothetical protein